MTMDVATTARSGGGSDSQTAMRLLISLDVLGTPVPAPSPFPTAVKVVKSLTRLEKLDFWMRNPDYLADELLNDLDNGILEFADVEPHVARMLAGSAPALHQYPMSRYLYGAYERVDNALSILKSLGLINHKRVADAGSKARRDYYLLAAGAAAVDRMRAEIEPIAWYDQQARAILLLASAQYGTTARTRQYEQPEYKAAAIGVDIPSILDRVIGRAAGLGIDITTTVGHP